MPRIRTIKPEFPQSESMGRVSRDARLLFVQMWTLADDSGRLRGTPRMLASLLFPYDDDAPSLIGGWLDELTGEGCIVRYEVGGSSYVEVVNWRSHQKIDRATQSKIPPPPKPTKIDAGTKDREDSRGFDEDSTRTRHTIGEDSSGDLRIKDRDQGEDQGEDQGRIQDEKSPQAAESRKSQQVPRPDEVEPQVWDDWLVTRRAKRSGIVTPTVLGLVRSEAEKAGVTLNEAIKTAAGSGWVTFKASYVAQKQAPKTFAQLREENTQRSIQQWVEQQEARAEGGYL